MKVTKPAEVTEVCDICQREKAPGPLTTCIVCGNKFCLTCRAIIAGCWVFVNVGTCCSDRDDVRKVVSKYADKITPIIKQRTVALKRLPELEEI